MKINILKAFSVLLIAGFSTVYGQSVGSVDGVFNVSDMGAANYSIPIKVPDGVNGLKPAIAINYSSQGGSGPMGMGWAISGLSAITRTGNTIYHDKKVQSLNLTLDDKLSLDGNRLMLTSGTYGVNGSLYHTEIESFREIKAIGSYGNGPLSFSYTDQDGLKYEYGLDASSRLTVVGTTEAYAWYLSKVSDLCGNFMYFDYDNSNGEIVPISIKYNYPSGSLQEQSKVVFQYTTNATNPNFTYVAGRKFNSTKRLTGIIAYQRVNNSAYKIYRSYTPTYTDDFYMHLTKITEKGVEEAETLRPTEFEYGATTDSYYGTTVGVSEVDAEFAMGDYNGDGKTDYVKMPRYYSASSNNWQLFLNNGGQFTATQTGTLPAAPTQYLGPNLPLIPRNYGATFFDFNGDGKDDFVYQATFFDYSTSTAPHLKLNILLSDGVSLSPITIFNKDNNNSVQGHFNRNLPFIGDFDGDGKTEILYLNTIVNNQSANNYLIGDNYLTPVTSNLGTGLLCEKLLGMPFDAAYINAETSKILVIDYDGDGKNEILSIWRDGSIDRAQVFKLNVTFDANNKPTIGNPAFTMVNEGRHPTIFHDIITGDFNGDRITDYLTYSIDANWQIGYGDGAGKIDPLFNGPAINPPKVANNIQRRSIVAADFNGDGKTDIFDNSDPAFYNFPSQAPRIFYSKGNNYFSTESNLMPQSSVGGNLINYWLGDFNGDGATDFLNYRVPGDPLRTFTFHPFENKHQIVKFRNGLGSFTNVQYKTLTDPSVSSAGASSYPYVSKQIPIKVVSRSILDDGISTTGHSISYFYSTIKYNVFGKGLLGFSKVTTFDEVSGMRQEKNFSLNTTYSLPYLSSIVNTYNPNAQTNTPLSNSTMSYGIYSYGNNRIFPYVTSSTESNTLTGQTSVTTNGYTFYIPPMTGDNGVPGSNYSGKPTSITVNKGNGLEITTQQFKYPYRIPTNAQAYSGEPYSPYNYINSKPYKVVTTTTRAGQPSYVREARFDYSPVYGYLTGTITDPGTSNAVITVFGYDAYGNLLRKLKAATGLPNVGDSMKYDVSHRYVVESFNIAFPNIKNKATYDPISGLKLTNVDPDGFTIAYTYDAFGRVTVQSDNNGGFVATSYNWGYLPPNSITPYVPEAVYYTGIVSNTGELYYTKFDRLGRELCGTTKNFQGKWVSTKKWYNSLGQVAGNTRPTFSDNTTPLTTTNTYDVYGRLIQTNAPEGNSIISYGAPAAGGYTVTQKNVAANQESKVKTDFSGRKVEVTDAVGNVMSYTYHSNGEVKTVAALGATLQSYVYDNFGRLTERQDPNYGSYIYTYNAYGQKIREKDPKGNDFGFKYDALERMYQKTGPDGNYDYTFENNAGLNCGKITVLAGNSGTNVYNYGLGDKVNFIDYQDGGTSLNFVGEEAFPSSAIMNYDLLGRLRWKQYPTGAKVLYSYSPVNGDLVKISDYNSGAVYFSKENENDLGRITEYTQDLGWGTTVTTKQLYDGYGLLAGQNTKNSGASSSVLRDLKYHFDPATGNLTSRKDAARNLEELFTYDKLNRLTNIASPAGSQSFAFEANGNISQKSDAGTFSYDPANRLSKIQPFVNIPTATQQVEYTSFNKVSRITEGNMETHFLYGANDERNTMYTLVDGEVVSFKSYAPDVEREFSKANGDRTWTYIRDPEDNIVAIIAKENGVDKNYVVLTDHLGSFTHIVDANGAVVEEKSYDAWGRLRSPQDWHPYAANLSLGQPGYLFDRGYIRWAKRILTLQFDRAKGVYKGAIDFSRGKQGRGH